MGDTIIVGMSCVLARQQKRTIRPMNNGSCISRYVSALRDLQRLLMSTLSLEKSGGANATSPFLYTKQVPIAIPVRSLSSLTHLTRT